MKFKDLINQTSEWLKGTDPESDIVISSRIRLARNINGLKFVDWSDPETKEKVMEISKQAIFSSNYMKDSLYVVGAFAVVLAL